MEQDLSPDPVLAQVHREAEGLVRLDGVHATVLQVVRLELVRQADPAALLAQVHQDAALLRGQHLHGLVELHPAVAPLGAEDVPGQALGMDPDEDFIVDGGAGFAGVFPDDQTVGERHVLLPVDL